MNSLFRQAIERYFARERGVVVEQVIFDFDRGSGCGDPASFEIRIYGPEWSYIAQYRDSEAVQFLDRLIDDEEVNQ